MLRRISDEQTKHIKNLLALGHHLISSRHSTQKQKVKFMSKMIIRRKLIKEIMKDCGTKGE